MGSTPRAPSDHARIGRRFAVLVASTALLLPAQAVWLAPPAVAATCPAGSTSVGSGHCQVIFPASTAWTIPADVSSVDVVAVGGGGGGGSNQDPSSSLPGSGGGGGGGAVVQATYQAVTPGASATITVGAGGAGGLTGVSGTAGETSSFVTGGVSVSAAGGLPGSGGSWHDGYYIQNSGYGGASGAGYAGGLPKLYVASPTFETLFGGGGGGSSAPGANAGEISGGDGGAGTVPSAGLFAGYATAYAGGGGGGSAGTGGNGSYATSPGHGVAGGGNGNASTILPGNPGAANTGGGGGSTGSFTDGSGGAGGSGLVIVRFLAPGGNWSQTITFTSTAPSNAAYGGTYTPTAGATSGLPVSFSIDGTTSSICSISAGVVHFTGVGICTIDANQAGGEGGTYNAAPQVQQSFSVGKASQMVGWTSPPPSNAVVGGTWQATGFSSSGLPVTFVVQSGSSSVCSVDATTNLVSFQSNGYCAITVTQAGNANYDAATPVLQSFNVAAAGPADQTISFTTTPPGNPTVGETYTPAASATSGLTVAVTIDAGATSVCSIDSTTNVVTFNDAGTCTIDANQAGSDGTFNAAPQVQQTLTVAAASPGSTPTGTGVVVAPAFDGGTSPVTVTFGTVTAAGTTSLTVGTTPPASLPAGYQAGSATFFDLETTATFGGTITVCFSYAGMTPGPTNLLHYANDSWVDITSSVDTTDQIICATTASLSPFALVTLLQSQTISFNSNAPTDATVGGPTYTPTASASSDLDVVLTIDSSSNSTCSIDGSGVVSFTAAGTCTIDANQAGDANYAAAPQVQQSITIAKASSTVTVTCTVGAPYTYTGSAQTPCTAQATGAGMSPLDVTGSLSYANNTNAGTATASASWAGDANHTGNTGSGGFTIAKAPTSVFYMGGQIVTTPNPFTLSAQRSGPASCPISYALDTNPTTGDADPYALVPGSGGVVSTSGWQEGAYILTVTLGGNTNCLLSTDQATLTVASPGDAASGGGWYTLSGSGRVNIGFTVKQVPKASPVQYKGQFVVVNNGKWRLKGTLTTYARTGSSGASAGTGSLYWWNQSLNGGLGDWALAASNVAYTISFTGGTKKDGGSFAIHISYVPAAPQPGSLPNSTLTPLKGGTIRVN